MFYKLFPIFAPKSVKTIARLENADSGAVNDFYTNLEKVVSSKKITDQNKPQSPSPEDEFFDACFVRYIAKNAVSSDSRVGQRPLLLSLAKNSAYKSFLHYDALDSSTKSYQKVPFKRRGERYPFFHEVALAITKNRRDLSSIALVKLFVEDAFIPYSGGEDTRREYTNRLTSDLVTLLGQSEYSLGKATRALEYARVFTPPDAADCSLLHNQRTAVTSAIAKAYPDALDLERTQDPTLLLAKITRNLTSALPK